MDSFLLESRHRAERAAAVAVEGSIFNPLYISLVNDEVPDDYVAGTGTPYGAYPLSTGGVQMVQWDFGKAEWESVGWPLARIGETEGGGGFPSISLSFRINNGWLQHRLHDSANWSNSISLSDLGVGGLPNTNFTIRISQDEKMEYRLFDSDPWKEVEIPVIMPTINFENIHGNPDDNSMLASVIGDLNDSILAIDQEKQNKNSSYLNRTSGFTVSENDMHEVDRVTASSNITVLLNSNPTSGYCRVIRQVNNGKAVLSPVGSTVINGPTETSGPGTSLLIMKIGNQTWDVF